MTTDELNKQYDNLLRKEGYIKGMFAIANMIEKFLPKLQKLNGKQCCTVLLESIREQAKERKKECKHFIPLPFPAAPYGHCAKNKASGYDGRVHGKYSVTNAKGVVKHCFEPKEQEIKKQEQTK